MSDLMKANWKNLIFIVLFVVVIGVFTTVHGERQATSFELEDERFLLHGPENYTVTVELAELASLETRSAFSPGRCLEGVNEGAYQYGTWENEELGQYALCKLSKLNTCIIMRRLDGSAVVFNFENTQTTEEFGKSFPEYLREQGYEIS